MARFVPSTTYHSPGDLVTASTWDTGPKALNDFLSNRPMFRGRGELNQSILNATWTAVQLAVNDVDTDGGHNAGVSSTTYTSQVDGWYWVKGCVGWNPTGISNVASRIDTAIAVNGGIYIGSSQFLTKGNQVNSAQNASALIFLNAVDSVEIWVRQFTGATQILDPNSFGTESELSVLWIHS